LGVDVDLVLFSRDPGPPRDDVWQGVESQTGVGLHVHRVFGVPRPGDPNRWETIARARNEGKSRGSSPWVLFLDDDVVLAPDCAARLLDGLRRRTAFAALAADYNAEMAAGAAHWDYPPHVGMGAVLFRRERLAAVTFRWEPNRCECGCCCDDLRRGGFGIGYQPGAVAWHRPLPGCRDDHARARRGPVPSEHRNAHAGRILAAFDRAHIRKFRRLFLRSLRASGNTETVTAVVYDLYPGEIAALAAIPGVEIVARPSLGESPAARRIHDFQDVIARWPGNTPVAYWDAGDVLFQARLQPLWDLVSGDPDRLLVVREPVTFDDIDVVRSWVGSVQDLEARRRILDLFSANPVINAGFAAGTARALLHYFREAVLIRASNDLRGSTDWGDQTAMNYYCHTNPDAWSEIPVGWNFCLYGRRARNGPRHLIESLDGSPVYVAHGNAGSLGHLALLYESL
jgi:hypothetical protein